MRSASASIASKRTRPLQRTQGFGVRPASCSATKSSTTAARKLSSRSSVRCGRPIECASARAAEHRLRRAAAALAVALLVGPELQRHGDDLVARPARRAAPPRRCRRRRSSRRARGPARPAASGAPRRGRRGKRAVQRVGGEVGGMELPRRQAAQLAGDVARRRSAPRRARRRPGRATRTRCRPRSSRRSPRRRRSTSRDATVTRPHSATRTRSPQGAPPALPTYAPAGTGPRPRGSLRCCSKGMHPAEV